MHYRRKCNNGNPYDIGHDIGPLGYLNNVISEEYQLATP